MHCYSLTEQVMTGITVSLNDYPHVETPEGCPFQLSLDKQLTDIALKHADPRGGPLRLDHAQLGFDSGALVLQWARGQSSRQALVRLETAGGDGGRVFLTSTAYDEELIKGHVKWRYRPFPPTGVNALVEGAFLERMCSDGAEILDLFVIMNPGASFRLRRTGRLEGASPEMVVQWTGRELKARLPRRYDARVTGTFAGAAS